MRALVKVGMVAAMALTTSAVQAAPYVLTNGSGDGQVSVGVDGYGAFGLSIGVNATNAIYNPAGATAAAGTTYESGVAIRLGTSGARAFLTSGLIEDSGGLSNPTVAGTPLLGASSFTYGDLNFVLTQTLTNLFDTNGVQNGTQLAQSYVITNAGAVALDFELLRYLDGDLRFDAAIIDGGGRLISSGREILFETDTATGSADAATFLGIYNDGGTSTGFEIGTFNGLVNRIIAGTALANTIAGDGGDADQFIDAGAGYDVTLGLGRSFSLGSGGSTTFTTYTIFGTGAPAAVVVPPTGGVPEPATWAMMIAGFGLVGGTMRRRSTMVTFAG